MNAVAKPTVSLVLGSGGARGYAHIGAIEELLAQGYEIRSIAGASMGALIGGVHAAGKLDAYRDWVRELQKLDVLRLLDWTFRGGGLIKGDRIVDKLRELIGEMSIEDLPIAYTAVAVDLIAEREVWFSRGSLFDAIRASIAIPTVFRPHHYQGRVLVDGGLLNPVPITPTLRDLTDCTIAVDLNAPAESPQSISADAPIDPAQIEEVSSDGVPIVADAPPPTEDDEQTSTPGYKQKLTELFGGLLEKREKKADEVADTGLLETFARSLDVVQATVTRFKLAAQPPDLLVPIPRNAAAFYEFHRADEMIEFGRARMRAALRDFKPGHKP
jgi:NTE family protein